MAILYIGPHRNPDFQSDYQLSPILAPDRLLAQFPPLLMTCGEKDPFVDDTLIFAGRVREAKRARRAELERIIAGKSSQFGEALRMSNYDVGHGHDGSQSLRALRRERERLAAETEEDWVQMQCCASRPWAYDDRRQLGNCWKGNFRRAVDRQLFPLHQTLKDALPLAHTRAREYVRHNPRLALCPRHATPLQQCRCVNSYKSQSIKCALVANDLR